MVRSRKVRSITPVRNSSVQNKQRDHIRTYKNGKQVRVNPGNKKPADKPKSNKTARPKFWGDKESAQKHSTTDNFKRESSMENRQITPQVRTINNAVTGRRKTSSLRELLWTQTIQLYFSDLYNKYHGKLSFKELQRFANVVIEIAGAVPLDIGLVGFKEGELKNFFESLRKSDVKDEKLRRVLSMIKIDEENHFTIEGLDGEFPPLKLVALGYFCVNEITNGEIFDKLEWLGDYNPFWKLYKNG